MIAPRGSAPTIIHQQHPQHQHHQLLTTTQGGKVVSVAGGKPGQPNMTIVSKHMIANQVVSSAHGQTRTMSAPMGMATAASTASSATRATPTAGGVPMQIPMSQSAIENVKKCKNFLTTLIKLASNANQAPETVQNVKDLVQNLIVRMIGFNSIEGFKNGSFFHLSV